MGRTPVGLGSLMVACMITTGCLEKDTTETIYLNADGSATWTVLEEHVRSDQVTEEADYMTAVYAGQHPVARALQALTPVRIDTNVLRATRPYAVYTEATFRGFDDLMDALGWEIGVETRSTVEVRSTVERRGPSITWTLTVRDRSTEQGATDSDPDIPLEPLLDALDQCRFVLAAGRFTSAVGFGISGDGRVATMRDPDSEGGESATKQLVVSLTWTAAER